MGRSPSSFRRAFATSSAAETKLVANGLFKEAGGLLLEKLDLQQRRAQHRVYGGNNADGFLQKLKLAANIASGTAAKVVLPVPGGATTVERADSDGCVWDREPTRNGAGR